ncbi:TonB-dependent receptor [Flammeovirga yaeyamensis]|uniref:TonB-dependent receptor n=1 Tax=Flammeovirga yaeyamensis TaxID=367791 RepID=A0AAX1N6G0_9BACT|nr:TonB-dependent receptor [Flammeovirga yaeyamensis]MBB3698164.1 outer membrane receptor protein involved in Fe transport [Flammeovirga yaeyamensis]NMF34479.1 TonB-dependent receptor [Flammeovirga yaeyamensis]QWG01458.1 TonB-dependent receptor [Flammeovirga yaeyamensis]
MNKYLISFAIILLTTAATFAQKGIVKGTVKDADTGEEVIGASVSLEGTTTGASSDVFGNFQFTAPAGTYNVIASFIGYKKTTQEITVVEGQETVLNLTLAIDAQELEAVEIVGKANTESAGALMVERQKADVMIQAIGAEEMSVKGISDVEDAVTNVTGITKVESKGLFVRGLGDRYNNATVNGLVVPSTDPGKKVIDLGLFSSDIVRNIDINKTFNPALYGDFAGATVDVVTKDYPEEGFFNVGLSGAYNTQATGQEFRTFQDGDSEFLGFSGNGRALPAEMNDRQVPDAYNNSYTPSTINAMPNIGVKLSGGNLYEFDNGMALGFIAAGSFDNKYNIYEGVKNTYRAEGSTINAYDSKEYEYSTKTTAMGNLFFKINDKNSVSFNNFFINQSSNSNLELFGKHEELGRTEPVFRTRNTYEQSTVNIHQLVGDHKFGVNDRLKLTWGGGYSKSNAQEPDRRQITYRDLDYDAEGDIASGRLFANAPDDSHRFWSDMNEDTYSFKLATSYGFGEYNDNNDTYRHNISVGYNSFFKQRDFEWWMSTLSIVGRAPRLDINDPQSGLNDAFEDGSVEYKPIVRYDTKFSATQNVNAFYADYGFDIVPSKLKMNVGARYEKGYQEVVYKQENTTDPNAPDIINTKETDNILPSLGLKYTVNEKSNVRFAASQTLIRPLMSELIPFRFTYANGQKIVGNPDLESSQVTNIDLKYEIFPNSGELFSVGVFGKKIENSIELVTKASAITEFEYVNAGESFVAGIEVEVNKRLSNVFQNGGDWLNRSTVGANLTLLTSETDLSNAEGLFTNKKRAMFGASPYMINIDASHEANLFSDNVTSIFTVTYNTFGDRLAAAGAQGAGDIYERSYGTLNFIWKNRIGEKMGLNLTMKNLLNPDITLEQEFTNGTTGVVETYKRGVEAKISFTYSF